MTTRLHETSIELDVPFFDCDPLGVVWHGHYFKYLELARSAMLGPLGYVAIAALVGTTLPKSPPSSIVACASTIGLPW